MLAYLDSFHYMSYAVLSGEFVLHTRCCFMWEVSLTRPAVLCGEFLLHAPCCFMWGVSLARCFIGVRVGVPYTPLAVLCGEILQHGPCYFMWGISLTQSVLIYVGASLTLLVLIFMEEVCFPCPMLCDIRNLSYTPYASLCGEVF